MAVKNLPNGQARHSLDLDCIFCAHMSLSMEDPIQIACGYPDLLSQFGPCEQVLLAPAIQRWVIVFHLRPAAPLCTQKIDKVLDLLSFDACLAADAVSISLVFDDQWEKHMYRILIECRDVKVLMVYVSFIGTELPQVVINALFCASELLRNLHKGKTFDPEL